MIPIESHFPIECNADAALNYKSRHVMANKKNEKRATAQEIKNIIRCKCFAQALLERRSLSNDKMYRHYSVEMKENKKVKFRIVEKSKHRNIACFYQFAMSFRLTYSTAVERVSCIYNMYTQISCYPVIHKHTAIFAREKKAAKPFHNHLSIYKHRRSFHCHATFFFSF